MVLPPVVLLGVVVAFCPVFAPPEPVMPPGGAEVVPVVLELLLSGRGVVCVALGDECRTHRRIPIEPSQLVQRQAPRKNARFTKSQDDVGSVTHD